MKEFILMMAYLMAMVALSIDAMLPALAPMSADLHLARYNEIQFVIGFIFTGMTLGQIFYGPISDAIGRKRALYSGLLLFAFGCIISWHAQSLPVMLAGRFLQGLGVSAPRVMTVAIVRDRHHGRDMAYIMSMVMGVFILVPAIAPSLGLAIMHASSWRMIFPFYILMALSAMVWVYFRLEETLTPEHRRPFCMRTLWRGFKEAATTRLTLGYTLCCGFTFSALLGYLTSSQQIFQELFAVGDAFAFYFGSLALAIGLAFFTNSVLVRKYGMRRITRIANRGLIAVCSLFLTYTLLAPPSLHIFLAFAMAAFFCLGLMFGNMSTLALEPMGHMAGLGSAFNGAISSAISLLLGSAIGQMFNGTLLPLAVGFMVFSVLTCIGMEWTERGHQVIHHPS